MLNRIALAISTSIRESSFKTQRGVIAAAAILILVLSFVPVSAVERVNEGFLPAGPFVKTLRFQYYGGQAEMVDAFRDGSLDLMDLLSLSSEVVAEFLPNPDIAVTPPVVGFTMNQLDVNMLGDRWAEWGGCDFDHGNSDCGIQIRKGIAHLMDKEEFIDANFPGFGLPIDVPASPAQSPGTLDLDSRCLWDSLHPDCVSAYNIAPDPGGFPDPDSSDFCAARDHFVAAGIGLEDANDDCVIDNPSAEMVTNPIRVLTRSDDVERRKPLGEGIVVAINEVLGDTVAVAVLGDFGALFPIFLCQAPGELDGLCPIGSAPDDWELYTGGWGLGAFADHPIFLYSRFFAKFDSPTCEPFEPPDFNSNYGFVCVEPVDDEFEAAQFAETVDAFVTNTLNGFDEFGERALTIPAFTIASRWAYLNAAEGVVDQVGLSPDNFWTLLNIREDGDFTPVNPIYAFGDDDGNTVRWGQSFGTNSLNVFAPLFFTDANVLNEIYDTPLRADPFDATELFPWMAESFEVLNDPDLFSLGYEPPAGTEQTIRFEFLPELKWHDGVDVTADDAKFSLLNFRDILGISPNIINVDVLSEKRFDVHFADKSFQNVFDAGLGGVIPMHIWGLAGDTTYDGVPIADPAKTDPSYDPLVAGTLIGSGPFLCRSLDPPLVPGGGCALNADGSPGTQTLGPGASLTLEAFKDYHHPSLQALIGELQEIIDANPGTSLADKLEDAVAQLQTARTELDKTPPDNQAAVGNLEGGINDVKAAVDDGLLAEDVGIDFMDQLALIARLIAQDALNQAVACDPTNPDLEVAQESLDAGDTLRTSGASGAIGDFKDAVNAYKDALSKAEGVLSGC